MKTVRQTSVAATFLPFLSSTIHRLPCTDNLRRNTVIFINISFNFSAFLPFVCLLSFNFSSLFIIAIYSSFYLAILFPSSSLLYPLYTLFFLYTKREQLDYYLLIIILLSFFLLYHHSFLSQPFLNFSRSSPIFPIYRAIIPSIPYFNAVLPKLRMFFVSTHDTLSLLASSSNFFSLFLLYSPQFKFDFHLFDTKIDISIFILLLGKFFLFSSIIFTCVCSSNILLVPFTPIFAPFSTASLF